MITHTYIHAHLCGIGGMWLRLFTAIIKIFVEVDMEQVEHDPVHGGPKPGAQPPDASDHPLDQSLLVRVRVHRHEGGDGGVGYGAHAGQHPSAPHHPGLGAEPVPGVEIK